MALHAVDGDNDSFAAQVLNTSSRLAPLDGRRVFLRPILASEQELLRLIESSPPLAGQWRFRGSTPSPEAHVASLWAGVLAQYLVVSRESQEPVGIVAVFDPHFGDGFAELAAAKFEPATWPVPLMQGLALFVEHVFRTWSFRKLYVRCLEPSYGRISSAVGWLLQREGTLREHAYVDGTYVDQHVLALYRETWERESTRILAWVRGDGR